ncbi:MAG TPA: tetratricopeptide repeat protein [Pseudolabrys sp.]|nr:tetratricopeptide repeat protein [Pseudolabrys sp.]
MNRQQRRAAKDQPAASAAGALFASAVQHHQAGRLAEAEACYRRVLAAQPDHADAAFNLGVALRQLGKAGEAIAAYAQALRIKPDYPEAHYNLGNALMAPGNADEAITAYTQALRINPDHAQAAANLGVAYSNRGVVLMEQNKYDEAASAFGQSLALKPDHAEAHYNLGNLRKRQGRLVDAAAAYALALRINPNLIEAHSNLGNTFAELGRYDEAVAAHRAAIALKPDLAEVHYNLGNALKEQSRLGDAASAYRRAIGLNPNYADAYANLGIVLMEQGRLDEAASAFAQATALKPDDTVALSNRLVCLNYDDSQTSDRLLAAHREWDERYAAPASRPGAYANDRAPGRRLKVGYVSPDLRAHSVAYFLTPLLENHSKQAVEVFCYAGVVRPDAVTAHLRGVADHWCSTVAMPDDALAERIRTDGIDILIDLAGHTAHNRLRVFARKPAPVQATWLGYPNTTGLRAIDYRLVDDVTDPRGTADAVASETLLRLANGMHCYAGLKDAPEPAPPPCVKSGVVTFGSFNNLSKISAATLDVWAKLLTQMPSASLLLKGKPFADEAARNYLLAHLRERGVAAERVQLVAWLPQTTSHLALYEQIDIGLDPFPYNGTTTTCEALWMGVPVVTLRGEHHAARVGASLLGQAGLPELIAGSAEDYAAIASALAADPERLAGLRSSLRRRMMASPLCDGKSFARNMEAAFRTMWQRWCAAPE